MRPRYLLLGLVAVLLLSACRSRKPVAGEVVGHRDLHPRSPAELLGVLLDSSVARPRYFSAKADVTLETQGSKRSFKAQVRVVRDSAAWFSITPALGIEVARAMITPDSLKIMDKLHDQYWAGDTGQAKARFGVQPSLTLLQDAFLGLPIGLDSTEKYRSGREDGMYTLALKERRRFIRAAEDLAPGDTLPGDRDMRERRLERTLRRAERKDPMVYKYWIDPDSLFVERVLISELAHDQQADVRYMQRKTVEDRSIPTAITLSLSAPGQAASGTLLLDRIQLHGPLNLPFRIPDKFTPMD